MSDKPLLGITDHALLRWMERAHGVDVSQWRALMAQAVAEALEHYHGVCPDRVAAFVINDGNVVTFLDDGFVQSRSKRMEGIAVPMV